MAETSPSEFVQDIEYNHFTNSNYNVDFKGAGKLQINPEGTTFTFSGKPRGLFSPRSKEITFQTEDIQNVEVVGSTVLFKTSLGKSGSQKVSFVFHLPDANTARSISDLLPTTKDVVHLESADFAARLDEVAGSDDSGISLTKIFIGLNALGFVVMGLLGAGWVQTADMMPYIIYGANNGAATTDGEWWRLLTSIFIHYGILHLALNMWALYAAGGFLERILGKRSFALTYIGAGIAGGFASIAWYGDQAWSAGASGAVFGVFGGLLGYVIRQKQAIPKSVYQSMLKSSLSFALYNILFGFARTGIDNAAHIGGLAGGFCLAWILALPLNREIRSQQAGKRLQQGLVALVVLLVVGVTQTPRFEYRMSDVLAWQDANEGYPRREQELLREQNAALDALDQSKASAELIDWLETQAIPFYENWHSAIAPLKLTPGKQTILAQEQLILIIDSKLVNYRQLVIDLRADNPDAKAYYVAAEQKVIEALEQLKKKLR